MKLNMKQTVLIGFAFLSISAFWELYDFYVPRMLSGTFRIGETLGGVVMAADNVLALFLLPFFGALSDRCHTRIGRRKPFILGGTLTAVVFMLTIPLIANSYHAAASTFKLVLFIVTLGILLVAMGIYRSPAVALMPDATPKPLRSKGNAVINLMGAVGGVLFLLANTILDPSKGASEDTDIHIDTTVIFAVVAGIMLIALLIVMLCVNEPKLAAQAKAYEDAHPEEQLTECREDGKQVIPKPVKKSLIFMLLSVSLWFIGYNAVKTWFSTFAADTWGSNVSQASTCLMIATVGAIISYIPVGIISSRIGRKKTILFGVVVLSLGFLTAFVYTLLVQAFHPLLYVLFALVGIAWASINVNSLPMVIEMCSGYDVGKFTGLYYTFSMSAQIITPILSGALYEHIGPQSLFIYAAVFAGLAFLTMWFVRHGDNKPTAKAGLDAFDVED